VHGHTSGLTSTPKAELFCSCKRRKFIGQNTVKILNFKVKKLVALIMTLKRNHKQRFKHKMSFTKT